MEQSRYDFERWKRVQKYAKEKALNEAVEQAVRECIQEGILGEFLLKNRLEAIEMSIFEYDEEKELALLREAEREVGWEKGREEGISALISVCRELGVSAAETAARVKEKFSMEEAEVQQSMKLYW